MLAQYIVTRLHNNVTLLHVACQEFIITVEQKLVWDKKTWVKEKTAILWCVWANIFWPKCSNCNSPLHSSSFYVSLIGITFNNVRVKITFSNAFEQSKHFLFISHVFVEGIWHSGLDCESNGLKLVKTVHCFVMLFMWRGWFCLGLCLIASQHSLETRLTLTNSIQASKVQKFVFGVIFR